MITEPLEEMPLEQIIIAAQKGNTAMHNQILKMYQPFIAKCVSEVCKRYINPKHDDEFSIGLSAFNDAILSFTPDKGSSFLSFAKVVVKRRVIDYIRSNQKGMKVVYFDDYFDEEQMENPAVIQVAKEKYQEDENTVRLRDEIAEFKLQLSEFKLSLLELTEVSPKHRDARESAIRTARILYGDVELREYVCKKKKLPIKNLSKKVDVSKKTLERNRKFILAIFIVISGDFIYLKDYLKGVGL